ncbi:hypothetical protein RRG08_048040 [Elysia crispata]|uniref:Uncharacterized protein n=1 Tax=Elysia crispata TaxID=231223 RepID=A0AAE0Z3L6_9GAST|nr:hypothetical protein RRG08_048040 [Elysia crispata]
MFTLLRRDSVPIDNCSIIDSPSTAPGSPRAGFFYPLGIQNVHNVAINGSFNRFSIVSCRGSGREAKLALWCLQRKLSHNDLRPGPPLVVMVAKGMGVTVGNNSDRCGLSPQNRGQMSGQEGQPLELGRISAETSRKEKSDTGASLHSPLKKTSSVQNVQKGFSNLLEDLKCSVTL